MRPAAPRGFGLASLPVRRLTMADDRAAPAPAFALLGQPLAAVRQQLDAMAATAVPEPEPEPEPPAGEQQCWPPPGQQQPQPFAAGQRVAIHGLAGSPELNGATGLVERYDETKGRYAVKLSSGAGRRAVAVKPQNLRSAHTGAGADAGSSAKADGDGEVAVGVDAAVVEKVYSDAIYLSLLSHGLSVCLKRPRPGGSSSSSGSGGSGSSSSNAEAEWACSEIYLYNEGVDGYCQYRTTALPHGLSWDKTNGEIVGDWGEPSEKSGGGSTPICLEYAAKGVELSFVKRNWEDPANPLAFITLFEHEP